MINCVRFRPSVLLDPMTPTLARLLGALDQTARDLLVDLTVTCGREGHPPTSAHNRGAALDVSVANLTPERIVQAYRYLCQLLDVERFTILYEAPEMPASDDLKPIAFIAPAATGPHFHLQVKKNTIYPPQDTPPPRIST